MNAGGKPLVSIVTPFHNTDAYLAECIESVLAQTYDHFEYVLLDNQSTDRSRAIAERYAAQDRRIRLISTTELLPQVANYNFGLRSISPDSAYVKMVQADDWLYPQCVAEMVALGERHPSVQVISSYELRGTSVCGSGALPPETQVISGREAVRLHLLKNVSLFGSPTTIMFRAPMVRARDPFYEEGRYFEDTELMYEVLHDKDFGFIHQVLSFARVHKESLWGNFRRFDPLPLATLTLIARYGRIYLDPQEFEEYYAKFHDEYFKMVARIWVQRPPPEFMEFHRKGLADAGVELNNAKLARYAVAAFSDELLPLRRVSVLLEKARALVARRPSG